MARQYTLHRSGPVAPRIDFAAELNPQQLEAVLAPPGPALVLAGAGSGKTRTLTYRVAYLVENGVQPQHILLLTFTNKAAREMLDRVASLIPNDLTRLWGGTFHSIGNRVLRRHPNEAGFAAGFSIMDREDAEDMMADVILTLGFDPKEKRFPKAGVIADILSYQLNTNLPLEQVLEQKHSHLLEFTEQIADARKKYELRKKAANAMDFDDLLEKTVTLLLTYPQLAEHYQRQFQFILVDEYQDTNHLQSGFIEILAARHQNVMAVGDDAQSIYSWRGANFRNILDFPKRYPSAKVYKIETNYRSIPEVLEVANAAIAANTEQFEKHLVSVRPESGVKPALVPLGNSAQQAQFVAQRILELHEEGMELNEIAVLYRAHFHSMELQMEMTRRGIPFQITSGLRFFEQAHVKDVGAILKWIVNPRDEVAFKRVVKLLPGIGPRSADTLWSAVIKAVTTKLDFKPVATDQTPIAPEGEEPTQALPVTSGNPWSGGPGVKELLEPLKVPGKAAKTWLQLVYTLDELVRDGQMASPGEMIETVLDAVYEDYAKQNFPNHEQRLEDLNTLANFAQQYTSAQEFLDQLALLTNLDNEATAPKEDQEQVVLSSVHQAKGLEWKAVFVIWLADGKFPGSRSLESNEAIEEERRLFYVAVTRAKDELYLTYPCMSFSNGYGDPMQRPSRFLGELSKNLVEEWEVGGVF